LEGTTFKNLQFRPGLKKKFRRLLNLRFELKIVRGHYIDLESHELTCGYFNKFGIPLRSSVFRRQVITVFSYHIIKNYRGWRYIRNLPIHGQRT